jgi:hypothetical protein
MVKIQAKSPLFTKFCAGLTLYTILLEFFHPFSFLDESAPASVKDSLVTQTIFLSYYLEFWGIFSLLFAPLFLFIRFYFVCTVRVLSHFNPAAGEGLKRRREAARRRYGIKSTEEGGERTVDPYKWILLAVWLVNGAVYNREEGCFVGAATKQLLSAVSMCLDSFAVYSIVALVISTLALVIILIKAVRNPAPLDEEAAVEGDGTKVPSVTVEYVDEKEPLLVNFEVVDAETPKESKEVA